MTSCSHVDITASFSLRPGCLSSECPCIICCVALNEMIVCTQYQSARSTQSVRRHAYVHAWRILANKTKSGCLSHAVSLDLQTNRGSKKLCLLCMSLQPLYTCNASKLADKNIFLTQYIPGIHTHYPYLSNAQHACRHSDAMLAF